MNGRSYNYFRTCGSLPSAWGLCLLLSCICVSPALVSSLWINSYWSCMFSYCVRNCQDSVEATVICVMVIIGKSFRPREGMCMWKARGSVGLRTLMLLQNWCLYQYQCITLQQKRSVYMSSFKLPGERLSPPRGEGISLPGGDPRPNRLFPPQLPLLLLGQ